MNKTITTILPFFNSGSALATMLDSILQGSVLPSEILLIDDGSSDNSPDIAKDYASRCSLIKYIKKEHGGVSAARNLGIEMATGDFISFLDADDYIEKTMYEQMLDSISDNVDGCFCGYFTEKDGISTEYFASHEFLDSKDLLKAMFTDDNVRGFLVTRLFKADLIKTYKFNTNISMCEDLLFQTTLLTANPNLRFACVRAPLYHYVQNSTSATNSINYFKDGIFKYKPAYDLIRALAPYDYIENGYNSILEFSMYNLLKAFKGGDNTVIAQVRMVQKELKCAHPTKASKRRLAYIYAPILFSYFLK